MNTTEEGNTAGVAQPHVTGSAAVLALKPLLRAKSRVDSVEPQLRQRLAWAMALDTLTCVASVVDHVVVVSDQPDLQDTLESYGLALHVLPEPSDGGLNPALRHGATSLRRQGFSRIVACVGDLPALHPSSLVRVLDSARPSGRSFVPDASGIGTTMLIADRTDLDPRFQGPSAAAHRDSGALPLTDLTLGATIPDARRDVDTEADLSGAYALGLGRHTAALIDPSTGRLGRYSPITVERQSNGNDHSDRKNDESLVVITPDGERLPMAAAAITDPAIPSLGGQRLHAVLADGRVLAAWL